MHRVTGQDILGQVRSFYSQDSVLLIHLSRKASSTLTENKYQVTTPYTSLQASPCLPLHSHIVIYAVRPNTLTDVMSDNVAMGPPNFVVL